MFIMLSYCILSIAAPVALMGPPALKFVGFLSELVTYRGTLVLLFMAILLLV